MDYSKKEISIIRKTYFNNVNKKGGWLKDLSIKLKRPKENISRYARKNGLTNRNRKQQDKKCIVCGKYFYSSIKKQQNCSKECGIITCSKKRTGKHIWKNRIHPKGMLGKHHTKKYCKILSNRFKKSWADKNSKYNSKEFRQKKSNYMSNFMIKRLKNGDNVYSRTLKGWRTIGNKKYYFKSKWEMNIARYLEWLRKNNEIINWKYESDTFWFDKIKRGVRSYTPDFKIIEKDNIYYIEVKGWMDKKSKTKLKRMLKYYPKINIKLCDENEYKILKKQIGRICNWE